VPLRRVAALLLGTTASLVAIPGARAQDLPPSCHEESRVAMGCTCTVRVCGGDEPARREAAAAALDEVDRLDRLMSHYRPESPLSRLNREAARGPVAVPPELLALLDVCLRWSRESDGAFDVTVGPLMKAWGFFQDEGRVPAKEELVRTLEVVGRRHVLLDRDAATVRFARAGVELDLGGIGKGYALDRVVSLLRARGVASALVNLGGAASTAWALRPAGRGGRSASRIRSTPRRSPSRSPCATGRCRSPAATGAPSRWTASRTLTSWTRAPAVRSGTSSASRS
jgi:thiamine biosynthesis lipoprotein